MNRLAGLFYKNSYVLWLAISVIIAAGVGSFIAMPRAEDPRIANRWAQISTPYPGATPQKVESQVTEPIENELRRAPEIKKINSISAPGLSFIYIKLKDSITDSEPIFSKLRDYIDDAKLPSEALKPNFDETRSYAFTKIITLEFDQMDNTQWLLAGRYANELVNRLRSTRGTEKVELFAEPNEEIEISVEPQKLSMLGISMTELANKIANYDAKLAAGSLTSESHRIMLNVSGGFDSLQRLRELPIMQSNSKVLLLKDIADIAPTPKMPLNSLAISGNKQALLIGMRMMPKQNIDNWNNDIDQLLSSFEKQLPDNIKLKTIFSQQQYTSERFTTLELNLLQGLFSIILILIITLGLRGALIVSVALPLTVLATLYLLKITDFSLHQITVIGLIVALGIMIDNAIVIAESIESKRLNNVPGEKAVQDTIQHFWLPLLGATLTTILTFLPIILLVGPTGEFVGGIGYSVIFTLVCSYIISHTIIAGLAGRYMPTSQAQHWWQKGISLPNFNRFFHKILFNMLAHTKKSLVILLCLSSLGFIAQFGLIEEFFPASDRNQINIFLDGNPSQDLTTTLKQTIKVNKVLSSYPQITGKYWQLGESFPSYYYNILMNKQNLPNFSQAMITVQKGIAIRQFINQLQSDLNERFPNIKIQVRKIDQGPPVEPIEIHIFGHNLHVLHQLGDQVRARLQALPEVVHTNSSISTGLPKITLHLNEQQVSKLNLTSRQLANEIRAFIDGVEAGFIQEGSEQIPVRVIVKPEHRQNLANILELPISFISVNEVLNATPISAIAEAIAIPEWFNITRLNNRRVNTITATIKADRLPEEALQKFKQSLIDKPLKMPPDYQISLGGEKQERDEAVQNLMASLPLICVLMLAVLVLTFQSLLLVTIIMVIIATSISMGLLCLFLSGYAFGFQVLVSLFGLVGLSINAAIIILSEIKSNPRAQFGNRKEITHSVEVCLRHITSTTLTTVAGFSPLLLANDLFWPPFAWTLAGGTLLTTMLSIFLVPIIYRLFCKTQ